MIRGILKRLYLIASLSVAVVFVVILLLLFVYFVRTTRVKPENVNISPYSNNMEEIFGEDEYECHGTCFCEDERRAIISGTVRPLRYFVLGLTSLLAMKQAKKYFHNECVENFADICDHPESIRSEIDDCVASIREEVHEDNCDCGSCGKTHNSFSFISENEKKRVLDGDVSIDGLIKKVNGYSNIIVLTGAGISVNAGIPDFRSPGTGLYDNMEEYGDLDDPSDVFNINYYKKNPRPFFELTKKLFPKDKNFQPTGAHYFIKELHDRGVLLRVYTQNVDGLEIKSGIPEHKVIEAHGSFRTSSCSNCGNEYDMEKFLKLMYDDEIPIRCNLCGGLIKPDVVFFGESLPSKFFYSQEEDFEKCDLLIVIGTSLVVSPFCHLVDRVRPNVPRLLINGDEVGPWQYYSDDDGSNYRDVKLIGDCDKKTKEFSKRCGWGSDEDD